jgi:hypothetical protein
MNNHAFAPDAEFYVSLIMKVRKIDRGGQFRGAGDARKLAQAIGFSYGLISNTAKRPRPTSIRAGRALEYSHCSVAYQAVWLLRAQGVW